MKRNLIVVDPLGELAEHVKKTLVKVGDSQLEIVFSGVAVSLADLVNRVKTTLSVGHDVALVIPFNTSGKTPVLSEFRRLQGNDKLLCFDLLSYVQKTVKNTYPSKVVPAIMPFVFVNKPEDVKAHMDSRHGLCSTLACLTQHIVGIDDTFSESEIVSAFRRHLLFPARDNFLMKDFIPKFID